MPNGIVQIPTPVNEPVRAYAPGSPERASLKRRLSDMLTEQVEIPLLIGGREVRTGRTAKAVCPHDHGHALAEFPPAGSAEAAIESCIPKPAVGRTSGWPSGGGMKALS